MAEEKSVTRRHSHQPHLHLIPTAMIDHLRTKVIRKRLPKHDSSDLSDSTLNTTINHHNHDSKQSNQDRAETPHETSIISLAKLPKKIPFDEKNQEENHEHRTFAIEQVEEDSVVPNETNKDADTEENIPTQTNVDINSKRPKRLKPIKGVKSLPETTQQINVKKRRQTARRTGFHIRDEDFNLIFSDLPPDEQLMIAYPCAWRKEVFMHGRLFLSVNYVCFYTCFFKWEESLCIAYKDIVSITREKSARLVPNVIKIQIKTHERYFFVSHIPREKIFLAIFRLWQNALVEQPLDYQQLRVLVYADQQNFDDSSEETEESLTLENMTNGFPESGPYTQSLPARTHHSLDSSTPHVPIDRRVISLPTSNNERENYLPSCTCETHLAKTYADRLFTLNVNTLFELLFTENSFTRNFHNAQKLTDYVYGEWQLNNDTEQRERQVTYKTVTQSILGSNSLSCREKQILEVEKPNSIYVLSSEVYNEGMKYTDAFYVATKFCMTQRDAEHSWLKVTAEIRYVKNVNSFIRSFIEKNANSSIEEGVNEQVRRLENQQVTQPRKPMSVAKQHPSKTMETRRSQHSIPEDNSAVLSESKISMKEKTVTGKGILYDLLLFLGIFLLILHIYLCYKLYSFDQMISTPDAQCLNQCQQTCLQTYADR